MIDAATQVYLPSTPSDTRSAALRSELEAARAAFQTFLQRATATGWYSRSPASRWTVGQVSVHLTWALEYLPEEVRRARQGRGMFNMPKPIADTLSYWLIRWIARTATPEAIGQRYDRAIDAALQTLATIHDDEWQRGADFYGEGFHTIEDLFHGVASHFKEHTSGM